MNIIYFLREILIESKLELVMILSYKLVIIVMYLLLKIFMAQAPMVLVRIILPLIIAEIKVVWK
ncbi:hypothetical protein [Chryseobacterium flavum]|uniref:hypothetical protein n=1 Tax=Chryseobacterium flavum TaxID=415851 RepID=UPI0028A85AA5|nr:hypothetical protein [Chryseobacterium flavum]